MGSSLKVRMQIDALRRVNLRTAEIDNLREQVNALMRDLTWKSPWLPEGSIVWRARRCNPRDKPVHRTELSYAPLGVIKTPQRANRPGVQMFYGSSSSSACLFELDALEGEHFALSRWRTIEKLLVHFVGYESSVFDTLASGRSPPPWSLGQTHNDRYVLKFLSEEFARRVTPGMEHQYKISVAIAEQLVLPPIDAESLASAPSSKGLRPRWAGVQYPSVEMKANADNFALLPWAVDEAMITNRVDWLRIDKRADGTKWVTLLDFADSLSADGAIEWKGRLPRVLIPAGETFRVTLDDGRFVVRNSSDAVVEPF